MSFLTKRNPSLLNSPLEQIAELAKRKQAFRDLLLNGDSISNAKTYFDNHLLPYLRDVFYLPASQEDFYTRALSLDPSSIELAIRLLRHAARFGQDEIVLLRFFDLFENDSRYLTMHFDFSHSSSQIDSSGLAFAEDLFKVYDSIGYLVPGLFAAHEIARVY